jgi:hypothetical protein
VINNLLYKKSIKYYMNCGRGIAAGDVFIYEKVSTSRNK